MSDNMFVDFEVILGTDFTDPDDRDLAIAQAASSLAAAHEEHSIWEVTVYGDGSNTAQIGVGFNVEVPEDVAVEFDSAVGSVVETIERI